MTIAGLVAWIAAPAFGGVECRRLHLSKAVVWPNGLQTLPSGDFLVASPLAGTLSRFTADGVERWTRRGGPVAPDDFENPAAITRSPNASEILVQDGFSRFYVADLEGTIVRKHSLEGQTEQRPAFSFVPPVFAVRGDRIGGLAMFRPVGGGPATAGLVTAALDGTDWSGPFTTVDLKAPEFIAYSLDSRMVTATASGMAMLVNGKAHEIRWVEGETVRSVPLRIVDLDPYPAGLRPGASAMGSVHQELRRLRLPVGVYWDRSTLFVLLARPNPGNASRSWELAAVDAESGRVLRRLGLPTETDELGISPGRDHWIVLEKRVQGIEGTQRAGTALRIPAGWFHDPSSPLTASSASPAALCRP